MNIVLKDKAGTDVTFTPAGTTLDGRVYVHRGNTLLDTKRITLRLVETKNTNRVHIKLSVPSVCTSSVDCADPVVKYTQVASADITVVRFASEDARNDLAALHGSLNNSDVIAQLITAATLPN